MRKTILVTIVIIGACILLGCAPLRTPPPPLPTETVYLEIPTPTATEIWFPPTPTPSPFPTATQPITPTLSVEPEFGEVIFIDDFSDPEMWGQTRGPVGSAVISNNELTIAIAQPSGYLYSLRQGTNLDNFYVEITTNPSICRGEDEYGLLVRVTPSFDFYRFSLTCDGRTRVDKYYRSVASSPQPLTYSSEVPPGAPSQSRLAVGLSGKEMQFFIDDVLQFTVIDQSIAAGTLGVFSRASGEGPITVNFSNLIVRDIP
jgi:hypothetical protein